MPPLYIDAPFVWTLHAASYCTCLPSPRPATMLVYSHCICSTQVSLAHTKFLAVTRSLRLALRGGPACGAAAPESCILHAREQTANCANRHSSLSTLHLAPLLVLCLCCSPSLPPLDLPFVHPQADHLPLLTHSSADRWLAGVGRCGGGSA